MVIVLNLPVSIELFSGSLISFAITYIHKHPIFIHMNELYVELIATTTVYQP